MIAHQDDDAPTLAWRVLLEGHQKVHCGSSLGPAIEDIAGLDQRRVASGPPHLGVHQSRTLENAHKGIEVAMNIRNGHHAPCVRGPSVGRSEQGDGEEGEEESFFNRSHPHSLHVVAGFSPRSNSGRGLKPRSAGFSPRLHARLGVHWYSTAPAPFSATSFFESSKIASRLFNRPWIW